MSALCYEYRMHFYDHANFALWGFWMWLTVEKAANRSPAALRDIYQNLQTVSISFPLSISHFFVLIHISTALLVLCSLHMYP
jgi:hypothetical protein